MHTADNDARKSLLDGRCGISISPKTATLSPGQRQQFAVSTPSDVTVTWSADCGTIDQNGLYTATAAGTCTVKAQSNTDPNVSDTAKVTIPAGIALGENTAISIEATDPFTEGVVVPLQTEGNDNMGSLNRTPPFSLVASGPFQSLSDAVQATYNMSAKSVPCAPT